MYGRCETDPFDQAIDVCDSCYGEFCSGCLVTTRRRKHPVCKECTIIASGIRPGAKTLRRGSKKTAADRREALRNATQGAVAFEYFDETARSSPRPEPDSDSSPRPEPETEPTFAAAPLGTVPDPETEPAGRSGPTTGQDPNHVFSMPSPRTSGMAALAQRKAERPPDRNSPPPVATASTAETPRAANPAQPGSTPGGADGLQWVVEAPPGGTAPLPSRRRDPRAEHPPTARKQSTSPPVQGRGEPAALPLPRRRQHQREQHQP